MGVCQEPVLTVGTALMLVVSLCGACTDLSLSKELLVFLQVNSYTQIQ